MHQDHQVDAQRVADLLADVVDLLAQLQVADQALALVPGLDRTQGQGAQRSEFDTLGFVAGLLRLKRSRPGNEVAAHLGLVHPEHNPAVGVQYVEVRHAVLVAQAFEQGSGAGQQGVAVAAEKSGLHAVVATDRAERGLQLRRVIADLQVEQVLHGPHAVGQVVRARVFLVPVGDDQQGPNGQEKHQAERDQDRTLDFIMAAHGCLPESIDAFDRLDRRPRDLWPCDTVGGTTGARERGERYNRRCSDPVDIDAGGNYVFKLGSGCAIVLESQ